MLYLRPYKKDDARTIISWCEDESVFRKWTADRYDSYPITESDMNYKYFDCNGDCAENDNFYPMTACDESRIVGHFILRYIGGHRDILRIGFVIIDDKKRGHITVIKLWAFKMSSQTEKKYVNFLVKSGESLN